MRQAGSLSYFAVAVHRGSPGIRSHNFAARLELEHEHDNEHEHDDERDGERCGRAGTAHFLHRAGSWDSQYGNWDKGGSSRKIMASIPV